MGGRFSIGLNAEALEEYFGVAIDTWEPRYNAAPTQQLPVVLQYNHKRYLRFFRFRYCRRYIM